MLLRIMGVTISKNGRISYKKVKDITAKQVQDTNQKLLKK